MDNHFLDLAPTNAERTNMIVPIINTIGLLFDIAGVVMLFNYAVNRNPDLSPRGIHPKWKPIADQSNTDKYLLYKDLEDKGLYMIGVGFTLQIMATWLSYFNF